MPPNIEISSATRAKIYRFDAITFLKTNYLGRKNAKPMTWEQIKNEVTKGQVPDDQAIQLLKGSLAKDPSVKVSGEPPLYSFNPPYDIHDGKTLLLKLRNSGGILWDDIISSFPNAKEVLSKLKRVDKKKGIIRIILLERKTPKKLVVHYNVEAKVVKLSDKAKELWGRSFPEVVDYIQIENCLKERSLSHLQHEVEPKHVPEQLKQLARLMAVSFHSVQEALVVERVIHFDCLYKKSLEILCYFQGDQLAHCLNKLVSGQILQKGTSDLDGSDFYFINYKKLFNFVRFRLHEIQMECLKHGWNSYYCTKCDEEFRDRNDTRIQRRDNGFFCMECKLEVEDVTTENRKTRTQILFQTMRPLYKLLEEIVGLNPVTGILKPQPAHPNRFQRDIDGYLTVKSEEDVLTCSGSEGKAVGMPTSEDLFPDWIWNQLESTTSAANEMPEREMNYSDVDSYCGDDDSYCGDDSDDSEPKTAASKPPTRRGRQATTPVPEPKITEKEEESVPEKEESPAVGVRGGRKAPAKKQPVPAVESTEEESADSEPEEEVKPATKPAPTGRRNRKAAEVEPQSESEEEEDAPEPIKNPPTRRGKAASTSTKTNTPVKPAAHGSKRTKSRTDSTKEQKEAAKENQPTKPTTKKAKKEEKEEVEQPVVLLTRCRVPTAAKASLDSTAATASPAKPNRGGKKPAAADKKVSVEPEQPASEVASPSSPLQPTRGAKNPTAASRKVSVELEQPASAPASPDTSVNTTRTNKKTSVSKKEQQASPAPAKTTRNTRKNASPEEVEEPKSAPASRRGRFTKAAPKVEEEVEEVQVKKPAGRGGRKARAKAVVPVVEEESSEVKEEAVVARPEAESKRTAPEPAQPKEKRHRDKKSATSKKVETSPTHQPAAKRSRATKAEAVEHEAKATPLAGQPGANF